MRATSGDPVASDGPEPPEQLNRIRTAEPTREDPPAAGRGAPSDEDAPQPAASAVRPAALEAPEEVPGHVAHAPSVTQARGVPVLACRIV